ncbi:hypothetical protein LEP1GSC170_2624 [Leptospira interrogans serovar Bataviae str. HAI135]|nr:hypothetical protein LEP1GSC170_2624 [Leptospira interrogans serovar Bataviae str. HAI135]
MFRNLWKDIQWGFRSIPLIAREWFVFYISFSGRFQDFWKEKSVSEKGLFIALTFQLLFSLSTWIEYSIHLGGEETEGLRVSSNFFLFFFLPVFFLWFVLAFSLVRCISFERSISSRLRRVSRYFFPESFFVNFLNAEDYVFSWKFYAFLGAWSLTTLFSLKLFFEKD